MTAVEKDIVEQIQKLTVEQQHKVLEFARSLNSPHVHEEGWTDEEIQELTKPRRKTMKEAMAWLDANPLTEEWGGMTSEDDPAEFIHNLRRQSSIDLADPGETE